MVLQWSDDVNGVIPSVNCYVITELKNLLDKKEKQDEDVIPFLTYLYFMCDPLSPYANTPEEDKEEQILDDIKTRFGVEIVKGDEPELILAKEKLDRLEETPTQRLYKAASEIANKIAKTAYVAEIDDSKDGNMNIWLAFLKGSDEVLKKVNNATTLYKEEIKGRSSMELGYDEDSD